IVRYGHAGRRATRRSCSTWTCYVRRTSREARRVSPAYARRLSSSLPFPMQEGIMEAHVTTQSQSFRLRQRAEEAHIRHGQEVRADVPNVRVTASATTQFAWPRRGAATGGRHGDVYFCNIGQIRIR